MCDLLSVIAAHSGRSILEHAGRRLELFPRMVRSLCAAGREAGVQLELVIADWPANRCLAPLDTWLSEACSVPFCVLPQSGPFNKGLGINHAYRAASSDKLLFLDCDMLVPAELLTRGMTHLAAGTVWFPGFLAQCAAGSDECIHPRSTPCGNAFMLRYQIDMLGGWPEQEHWGGFDRPVWQWFEAHGLCAEDTAGRDAVPGFIHLWHPKFVGWPGGVRSRKMRIAAAN